MSSLDGERSPKRARLGSYSPASPSFAETKQASFVHHPNTPPPSVRMSPSWQAPPPQPATSDGGEGKSGSGSVTFPTPPSTGAAAVGIGPARGSGSGEVEPESPENMLNAEHVKDGQGDTEMADRPEGASGNGQDADHRRTDHERQEGGAMDFVPDLPPVPRLYKPDYSPIVPSQPHPSQNMMTLFKLQDIQQSVARRDEHGNKINKLRKSYEGKVKALGLQGSSKPVPGNAALQGLLDPVWDVDTGNGETVWDQQRGKNPLEDEGLHDLLGGMLQTQLGRLKAGRLPALEHRKWESTLGLNEPKPAVKAKDSEAVTAKAGPANPLLARTAPGQVARASAPASPVRAMAGRPERTGRKRRYDDSSFEGYNQTFAEEEGSATDDGLRGTSNASKRPRVEGPPQRRDVPPPTSSPSPFNAGQSGMVGVRTS